MKILLVDDHEIVRRGLKQLLTEEFPKAVFGEATRVPQARELAGPTPPARRWASA